MLLSALVCPSCIFSHLFLGNRTSSLVIAVIVVALVIVIVIAKLRSSRPEVFCKKGVLGNLTKFTGKHLCQSLFFNKVAGLRPQACNFIKKETLAQVFSCECCEISKNTFLPFFTEHLWWLLLKTRA